MEAEIGDFVKSRAHGLIGVCHKKHDNFKKTKETERWFKMQELDELSKKEKWYGILVNGGGVLCVPAHDVELTEGDADEFTHPWKNVFFEE